MNNLKRHESPINQPMTRQELENRITASYSPAQLLALGATYEGKTNQSYLTLKADRRAWVKTQAGVDICTVMDGLRAFWSATELRKADLYEAMIQHLLTAMLPSAITGRFDEFSQHVEASRTAYLKSETGLVWEVRCGWGCNAGCDPDIWDFAFISVVCPDHLGGGQEHWSAGTLRR